MADQSENRQKPGRRKAPGTAFKPGQSGHPGGRPKRTQQEYDLMAACEAMTPDALQTIVKLMIHDDKDSVSLQAASFIIERRSGQSVEHKEVRSGPLDSASPATWLERRRQIEAQNQGMPDHDRNFIS